jgi:hypothetical protein
MTVKDVLHGVSLPDAGCAPPVQQARAATGGGEMTPGQILLYCGSCIALVVIGMSFLMRAASVSPETIKRSETPQTVGRFAPIPMGGLYGTVTVRELVNYYLQNPPPAQGGAFVPRLPKIGGC